MNSFKCMIDIHDYTEWSEIYYIGTDFGKLGIGYRKYRNRKCKCCGWVQEKLVDKHYYAGKD